MCKMINITIFLMDDNDIDEFTSTLEHNIKSDVSCYWDGDCHLEYYVNKYEVV